MTRGPRISAETSRPSSTHLTVVELDPGRAGHRGDGVAVGQVDAGVQRRQRDRAVHGAGVERREPERVGHTARHRRLPRTGGPVDGDHPAHAALIRAPPGP